MTRGAALLFLAACGANAAIGAASPVPSASPSPTASDDGAVPSPTVPTAAPSAASSSRPLAPARPAAPAPIASLFLPRQTGCSADADCGITTLALVDDTYECCRWCTPTAGTKAWVQSVEKRCDARIRHGFVPQCAPWDCAAPPPAKCASGTCVVGERP